MQEALRRLSGAGEAVMVVIPMFIRPEPKQDTPEAYEERCIVNDAQRAAKMGDDPMKANSWKPGSHQWNLWAATYCTAAEAIHG